MALAHHCFDAGQVVEARRTVCRVGLCRTWEPPRVPGEPEPPVVCWLKTPATPCLKTSETPRTTRCSAMSKSSKARLVITALFVENQTR